MVGASREEFAIENLVRTTGAHDRQRFFRTAHPGAEIVLIVQGRHCPEPWRDDVRWGNSQQGLAGAHREGSNRVC